jgi:hypothetical protein
VTEDAKKPADPTEAEERQEELKERGRGPDDQLLDKHQREVREAAVEFLRRIEDVKQRHIASQAPEEPQEAELPGLDKAVKAVRKFLDEGEVREPK